MLHAGRVARVPHHLPAVVHSSRRAEAPTQRAEVGHRRVAGLPLEGVVAPTGEVGALDVPPSVPRSTIPPVAVQEKAWLEPSASSADPTTTPLLLTATAELV